MIAKPRADRVVLRPALNVGGDGPCAIAARIGRHTIAVNMVVSRLRAFGKRGVQLPSEYAKWLFVQGAKGWIALVPALAPIVLFLAIPSLRGTGGVDLLRYAGMVLQLMGIGTVAYGLRQIRRQFQCPSLFASVIEWLNIRPKLLPRSAIHGAGAAFTASSTLEAHGRVKAGPNSSIEHRVEVLEQELDDLHRQVSGMSTTIRGCQAALQDERTSRENTDIQLGKRLEESMVGGLHLEFTGVLWLFVGVILGTVPDHIAVVANWAREVLYGVPH